MPGANTVAFSAPFNDDNGTDAGAVYVYEWNGNSWTQKGMDINGIAVGNMFGRSISMPNINTIAIGAPGNDFVGVDAGHVRIYQWNGTLWQQMGQDIFGEAAGDWFGFNVNMPNPNTVVITARFNDGGGSDAGSVYVYDWNGTAWIQDGQDIDGETVGDNSGFSVNMPNSNTVAIGALYNDGNGNTSGHARVYMYCPDPIYDSVFVSTCDSIYITPNGDTLTTSGLYTDTLKDANGCDSVITLINLVVNGSFTTVNISATACDMYISPSGNYVWKTSGVYSDTINNPCGCDTVYTIDLTIHHSTFSVQCVKTCECFYISPGGNVYTSSGMYADTLTNYMGCDSIIYTNLTLHAPLNTSITQNGNILIANANNVSYQWVNCDNNYQPIPGETNKSFVAPPFGCFAVIVSSDSGCVDTSDCICMGILPPIDTSITSHINVISPQKSLLFQNANANMEIIKIFPNPTNGKVTLLLDKPYTTISVYIVDVRGRLLKKFASSNTQKMTFNLNVQPGVYFLNVYLDNNKKNIIKVMVRQ